MNFILTLLGLTYNISDLNPNNIDVEFEQAKIHIEERGGEESPIYQNLPYLFSEMRDLNIDPRFIVALTQQETGFGRYGVGARTFNPCNIGNTSIGENHLNSWEEGISRCGEFIKEFYGDACNQGCYLNGYASDPTHEEKVYGTYKAIKAVSI